MTQWFRQGVNLVVLEQVNQLAQRAFIRSVRIHRVEPRESQAAQRAAAGLIEWEGIHKGRPACDAEVFGNQRLGIAQTPCAHRNARDFPQSFAADTAIVGKNQGEDQLNQAAKSLPRGAENTIRR